MKLRQLKVQGFRCISEATLSLDPEFTVLVGGNGSGKTAWLDAAAIALGGLLSEVNVKVPTFKDDQRRRVYVTRGPHVDVEVAASTVVEAHACLTGLLPPDGKSGLVYGAGEWRPFTHRWDRRVTPAGHTSTAGLKDLRRGLPTLWEAAKRGDVADLPVFAYYGSGRLWNTRRDLTKRREKLTSIFEGYDGCLDPTADQHLMRTWMQWRETVRFEEFETNIERYVTVENGKPSFRSAPEPQADAVSQAVVRSFGVEAAPGVLPVMRFAWSNRLSGLIVVLDRGIGNPVVRRFDELSDGYRSYIGLVADLAWRCVRLNPHLGERAPLEARGVVLIDELDLHLHPAWQLSVVDSLKNAFPKLQFVVTTHAPAVVSNTPAHQVRILDEEGNAHTPDYAEGRDVNALLRDIFGAGHRSPCVERELDALDDAIARGDLTNARRRFTDLRVQLGPGDARLMGLEWELTDAEQEAEA